MKTLPCIVCQKPLEFVFRSHDNGKGQNQPSGGVVFTSRGQYGSKVWDDFGGRYLEINICDDCILAAAKKKQAAVAQVKATPLKYWNGR